LRRRLHRRLVRTSTFAGSSSPSPSGTPAPTSPTVVSPHATRSDQPMCVIHPAPVTSVLVLRASSPSMEGCRCFASSGSRGATRGLLRRCILTAADYVHDLIVDLSLRVSRMVFVKLYGFFAISFEHRRHVIRITRPCARKSGFPSSLRLAQPRRQHRHLVPDYFVYSSNSRRWHLLPRLLLRLRPPWRPSLLVPPATASGCASSLARPVLATPVRAHRPRCVPEPGKLWNVSPDGLTASTSASLPLRLPRRVAIFVSGVFSITPPPWRLLVRPRLHVRLPCLRQPRHSYVDHGYSTSGISDHGYSSSPRLPRHRHKGLSSA